MLTLSLTAGGASAVFAEDPYAQAADPYAQAADPYAYRQQIRMHRLETRRQIRTHRQQTPTHRLEMQRQIRMHRQQIPTHRQEMQRQIRMHRQQTPMHRQLMQQKAKLLQKKHRQKAKNKVLLTSSQARMQKYTITETADGWLKVENEDGETPWCFLRIPV